MDSATQKFWTQEEELQSFSHRHQSYSLGQLNQEETLHQLMPENHFLLVKPESCLVWRCFFFPQEMDIGREIWDDNDINNDDVDNDGDDDDVTDENETSVDESFFSSFVQKSEKGSFVEKQKRHFFRSRCLPTETCAANLAILASSEYPSCDSTAEWREVRVERVAENERERERERESMWARVMQREKNSNI